MQKPIEVSQLNMVFGGMPMKILPPYDIIPDEFKTSKNVWHDLINHWFYKGLSREQFPTPKPDIELGLALANIQACLVCREPKHEHKIAGAAFLADLWFEKPAN
ncbi:hypothetical protein AGJ34_20420 [Cronobacter dublinensis subsp. dublinensis]|nr:hypothetical protein [Cronobacter dublinensis subsp. dublinensis]EGT5729670.1 hypothetical protein [Cronobacter dublinensis subsp. dublinensis]